MSVYSLSKEEISRYADQGYLGPFTLCSPEEMDVIRKRIEDEVLVTEPDLAMKKYRMCQKSH